jgi:transcriptional regulator
MLLNFEWGRPLAQGTVGIRVSITRFVCKIKMSQDKDPVMLAALGATGPFHNPELAGDMEGALFTD